jgi:hypothetical protein
MEYLKNQNAIVTDVNQPEAQRAWPAELFESQREGQKIRRKTQE